jgi:DNA repair exonuclease SbcCD ATPase subunit
MTGQRTSSNASAPTKRRRRKNGGVARIGRELAQEYQAVTAELEGIDRQTRDAKARIEQEAEQRKAELREQQGKIMAARKALGLDGRSAPVRASEAA